MYEIVIENLSVYYEEACALKDINLKIRKKDFLLITGPNGGGKTTLLKVLVGLMKPTKGYVKIKPETTIGYVPQHSTFRKSFPVNVFDVVLSGKLNQKKNLFYYYSSEDRKETSNILDRLGLKELQNRKITELSGGQLQKVLIARALAAHSNLLVLDEPTASLSPQARIEICDILKELNEKLTIIMVSHCHDEVSMYAKNIITLNQQLTSGQNLYFKEKVE